MKVFSSEIDTQWTYHTKEHLSGISSCRFLFVLALLIAARLLVFLFIDLLITLSEYPLLSSSAPLKMGEVEWLPGLMWKEYGWCGKNSRLMTHIWTGIWLPCPPLLLLALSLNIFFSMSLGKAVTNSSSSAGTLTSFPGSFSSIMVGNSFFKPSITSS